MSGNLPILLLAAGASSRMRGRDKLLEPVAGGQPLLAERVATAQATGQQVLLALPPRAVAPRRWRHAGSATTVEVPDPGAGMGASLACLARALPAGPAGAAGAMVLPADMPELTPEDLRQVLATFKPDRISRGAGADGRPGHPVLFPAAYFPQLRRLTGDTGARALLRQAPVRLVPLPARHALTDLDTPEDWQRWRAAGNR
ncbi:MAG TPA: nucleotidyltransferase family protein [Rhodobacteraceae bacterium]|nr:nucleotidyltransferase family protein [Paracoccaceae bacterium]